MREIEDKIIDALIYYKRIDLIKLLKGATYDLNISNSYGKRAFSQATGLRIYTDIEKYEKLKLLSQKDHDDIIKAFNIIYPPMEHEIELLWLEFYVDPTLSIPKTKIKLIKISEIDFDYLHEQIAKCDDKLNLSDYDGAITNCRSLLETIFKYILDKESIEYKETASMQELFKTVSNVLKMDSTKYEDISLKKIISGLFSIVQGINEIRNKIADAHGKSVLKRYKIKKRHTVD